MEDSRHIQTISEIAGVEQIESEMKLGYLYITKTWSSKDFINLVFPMEVQILDADTRVREDIGKAF
mgnify:CR=1 FL=1